MTDYSGERWVNALPPPSRRDRLAAEAAGPHGQGLLLPAAGAVLIALLALLIGLWLTAGRVTALEQAAGAQQVRSERLAGELVEHRAALGRLLAAERGRRP